VLRAPGSFLRLQNAFRRRDHLTILAEGDAVARQLAAEPDTTALTSETALMMGAAHAALERVSAACSYLEYGLAITPVTHRRVLSDRWRPPWSGRSSAPTPSPAPSPGLPVPPGSSGQASWRGVGSMVVSPSPSFRPPAVRPVPTEWAEMLLLDLYLRSGRYAEAIGRITSLLEPSRSLAARFTASRAQAAIAAMRSDPETAHHLLNSATHLARRIPSRFRAALVEGDRAILLAGQRRTFEAINIADRVLASLVRPLCGEYQEWSNAEGASIAFTLSRQAALGGDRLTAQRMLVVGEQAVAPLSQVYFDAHLALARAVNAGTEGRFAAADRGLIGVQQVANVHGYQPMAALALLEQGRIAQRRGLVRSAGPLYEQALHLFGELGQPREAAETRALASSLGSSLGS
jgi:tetratricopeptide (TPR) repeat protein